MMCPTCYEVEAFVPPTEETPAACLACGWKDGQSHESPPSLILPPGFKKPCACACHATRAPQDIPEGDDDDPVPPGCFPYHALRWKNHTAGRKHSDTFTGSPFCIHCFQPAVSEPCREVLRQYKRRGCKECLPDRRAQDICDQCEGGGQSLHSCPYDAAVKGSFEDVCGCCVSCQKGCLRDAEGHFNIR